VLEQSFTKLTAVKRTASSPGLDKCQYQPQIKRRNLKNISVWWKICIGIFRVGEFPNWEISAAVQITNRIRCKTPTNQQVTPTAAPNWRNLNSCKPTLGHVRYINSGAFSGPATS
jgi:hypothetical protein